VVFSDRSLSLAAFSFSGVLLTAFVDAVTADFLKPCPIALLNIYQFNTVSIALWALFSPALRHVDHAPE
jgi:hypothetical protein